MLTQPFVTPMGLEPIKSKNGVPRGIRTLDPSIKSALR